MMKKIWMFLLVLGVINAQAQFGDEETVDDNNRSLDYHQALAFYKEMSRINETAQLIEYGKTDVGLPLHVFVISKDKEFDPEKIHAAGKTVLLVNNAIHPGEPCGVDASVKLVNELILDKKGKDPVLDNVVLCIIPFYNIGGALNRGCCSRANQDGPAEKGFRGNARNLDLNRDFIKADSENAKSFAKIFHTWKPHVFIDTHTSNGADYQYTMTLISTQRNKLHPTLSEHMVNKMLPFLYQEMEINGWEMSPYVDQYKKTPDDGIVEFLETGRYSTGYTTLFNTVGFTTETHMLKPFKDRVLSTKEFIRQTMNYMNLHHKELIAAKKKADKEIQKQSIFPIAWKLDTSKYDMINFKGYEAKYKASEVTGQQRLYYDRKAPYEKQIRFYNQYQETISMEKPNYYIVPQAWKEVVERLQMNQVQMKRLAKDTTLEVLSYFIDNYKTATRQPYEGHYPHYGVEVRVKEERIDYHQGDYVIETNQVGNRYILETLEPQAMDAFFVWNFFDEILQQKEYFSDYVFEDKAAALLKSNKKLKKMFESKKASDPEFAKSARAQLYYLYQNSEHYEPSHLRYPVARIDRDLQLPLTD